MSEVIQSSQSENEKKSSRRSFITAAHLVPTEAHERRQNKIIAAVIRKKPELVNSTNSYIWYQDKEAFEKGLSEGTITDNHYKLIIDALASPIKDEIDPNNPIRITDQLKGKEAADRQMRRIIGFISNQSLNPQDSFGSIDVKKALDKCPTALEFENLLPDLTDAIVANIPEEKRIQEIPVYLRSIDKAATILYGSQWVYLKQMRLLDDKYRIFTKDELRKTKPANFISGLSALFIRLNNKAQLYFKKDTDYFQRKNQLSDQIFENLGVCLGLPMNDHKKEVKRLEHSKDFWTQMPNLWLHHLPESQRQAQIPLIRRLFEFNLGKLSGRVIERYATYLETLCFDEKSDPDLYDRRLFSAMAALDSSVTRIAAPELDKQNLDQYKKYWDATDKIEGCLTSGKFSVEQLTELYKIRINQELNWKKTSQKLRGEAKTLYHDMANFAGVKFIPGPDESNLSLLQEVGAPQGYSKSNLDYLAINEVIDKIEQVKNIYPGQNSALFSEGFLNEHELDQLQGLAGVVRLRLAEFHLRYPKQIEELFNKLDELRKKTGRYILSEDYLIAEPGITNIEFGERFGVPVLKGPPLLKGFYDKYVSAHKLSSTLNSYELRNRFDEVGFNSSLASQIKTLVNYMGTQK